MIENLDAGVQATLDMLIKVDVGRNVGIPLLGGLYRSLQLFEGKLLRMKRVFL